MRVRGFEYVSVNMRVCECDYESDSMSVRV